MPLRSRVWPVGASVLLAAICSFVMSGALAAQSAASAPMTPRSARDGQRDFDFEIGHWRTHLRYRAPLDSTAPWSTFTGTSVVSELMGRRANVVELDVSGPSGRIAGLSLRLYDPRAREWSLSFASGSSGELAPPVFGAFQDGRGEFIGLEEHEGRAVLVRFVIQPITPDSIRFEQSYSDDHGQHWILNWLATDTRLATDAIPPSLTPPRDGPTTRT